MFLFRRDLRLFDNHGFYRALSESLPVLPLYIFDTDILKEFPRPVDKRVSFIYDRLKEMNSVLLQKGKSLCVMMGKPLDIFNQLIESYQLQAVYCNNDYEPEAVRRDVTVEQFLYKRGASFHSFKDRVIFEKNEIISMSGKPYTVFTPYMKRWKEQLKQDALGPFPSETLLHRCLDHGFSFPPIDVTGYSHINTEFPSAQPDEDIIRNYHLTRDYPALNGTSKIGIHLRFGTVSVRQMVSLAQRLNETWLNELIWREFFMQLMFHNPYVAEGAYRKQFAFIEWRNDETEFERWCRGETGFPIVDAGMRELVSTGYMHNRVRMITANFLTKLLLIDWRWGEQFFAQHLLDFELSSNNGNWQWAAGTGADAAPWFRIFNPITQAKKFDNAGDYCRKWLSDEEIRTAKPMVDYAYSRQRALKTYKGVSENI